jgi:hypothetical protein
MQRDYAHAPVLGTGILRIVCHVGCWQQPAIAAVTSSKLLGSSSNCSHHSSSNYRHTALISAMIIVLRHVHPEAKQLQVTSPTHQKQGLGLLEPVLRA